MNLKVREILSDIQNKEVIAKGTSVKIIGFKYRGKEYKSKARLNYNKANRFIEKDAVVEIAVDPVHPVRSYIAELYFDR